MVMCAPDDRHASCGPGLGVIGTRLRPDAVELEERQVHADRRGAYKTALLPQLADLRLELDEEAELLEVAHSAATSSTLTEQPAQPSSKAEPPQRGHLNHVSRPGRW